MRRKNELCTIDVRIKGKIVNKKSEEVIHHHHLTKIPFAILLAKIGSEIGNFQTCLRDIPVEISKIYQKIGIDAYSLTSQGDVEYYHFCAKFIYREKDKIKTIDTSDHSVGEIILAGEKYQYNNLHFTIIPSKGALVADSKCNSKPLKYYLKKLMDTYLDVSIYKIDPAETKFKCITVEIRGDAKKDYQEIIKNNFKRIQGFGLSFGKPNKKLLNSPEFAVADDSVKQLFAEFMGRMCGIDVEKEESPFTNISINMDFKYSEVSERESFDLYKTTLSQSLQGLQENDLLKEAYVEYLDEDDTLERAVRRGVVKCRTVDLEPGLHDNNEEMWKEQVLCHSTLA